MILVVILKVRRTVVFCTMKVEIDEFQNYEKAMGALGESYKVLSKVSSSDTGAQEMRLNDLKSRMMLTKQFLQMKRLDWIPIAVC